ncbi:MAG: glycosyltransferase family 2 protein, partial [Bacteroidota bacterium]
IEKAGKLDEDFFMYAEEIEWCSRLRKCGPLVLYSNMPIVHLGGGSSSQYYKMKQYDNSNDLWSKKAQQIIVSQMLRVRKQWGPVWYSFILLIYIIEIPIFFKGLIIENIFKAGKASYTFKQFTGYSKNILKSIPYFLDIFLHEHKFYKVH